MTDFEAAVLRMFRSGALRSVFSLAAEHYNVPYPNKGQRAAVSRACMSLRRAGTVYSLLDDSGVFWVARIAGVAGEEKPNE